MMLSLLAVIFMLRDNQSRKQLNATHRNSRSALAYALNLPIDYRRKVSRWEKLEADIVVCWCAESSAPQRITLNQTKL